LHHTCPEQDPPASTTSSFKQPPITVSLTSCSSSPLCQSLPPSSLCQRRLWSRMHVGLYNVSVLGLECGLAFGLSLRWFPSPHHTSRALVNSSCESQNPNPLAPSISIAHLVAQSVTLLRWCSDIWRLELGCHMEYEKKLCASDSNIVKVECKLYHIYTSSSVIISSYLYRPAKQKRECRLEIPSLKILAQGLIVFQRI
jgi:hypothetical protein